MKRPFACFAIAVFTALPARADALREQVRAEAVRLLIQVNTASVAAKAKVGLKPAPLASAMISDLQRFGLTASGLSVEIDQRGGPTASTGAAQFQALSRLSHILNDAVEIAPAVGGGATAQTKTAANTRSAAANQCEAVRDF